MNGLLKRNKTHYILSFRTKNILILKKVLGKKEQNIVDTYKLQKLMMAIKFNKNKYL